MTACARKKVLLMILDGWGIGGGAADPADAISAAHPAIPTTVISMRFL